MVSCKVDWGLQNVLIKFRSGFELGLVQIISNKKGLGAIVFCSRSVSRERSDGIPTGIMKIARVGCAWEASVGDCVGVWVGDRWVVCCIDAFSSSIMDDFMNELPFCGCIFACNG